MSSIGVPNSLVTCARLVAGILSLSIALAGDCPPIASNARDTQRRLEELTTSAQRNMAQNHLSEALQDFKQAACLAPRDPRIWYGLGSTQAASGDFVAARKSLTTAAGLQPANPLPLAMLVRVNASMGDIDSLKAALLEISSRFARDSALHATLAQFLLQSKLPDLALAESLRSNQAGAPDGQAALDLAVLENTAGAFDDAIRTAVRLEGQLALPSGLRASAAGVAGLSYESAGLPELAISYLRKAIELDPSPANSYLALAFLFEKTAKYADAVEVLQQGRSKLPASALFLLPLGSDLILSEHFQAGVKVLQDLLKQSPDEYEAYLKIADAFRKMGESRQEVKILQDLAARNPGYPKVHFLLARALLTLDPPDNKNALDELDQAEKVAQPDADILYLRGRIYLAANRDQDAIVALKRAIELKPMDPAPYYQLGRLYQKLGKVDLAKATFERLRYLKSNGPG